MVCCLRKALLLVYIHIYIYTHTHTYIYMYIHIYIYIDIIDIPPQTAHTTKLLVYAAFG